MPEYSDNLMQTSLHHLKWNRSIFDSNKCYPNICNYLNLISLFSGRTWSINISKPGHKAKSTNRLDIAFFRSHIFVTNLGPSVLNLVRLELESLD